MKNTRRFIDAINHELPDEASRIDLAGKRLRDKSRERNPDIDELPARLKAAVQKGNCEEAARRLVGAVKHAKRAARRKVEGLAADIQEQNLDRADVAAKFREYHVDRMQQIGNEADGMPHMGPSIEVPGSDDTRDGAAIAAARFASGKVPPTDYSGQRAAAKAAAINNKNSR